MNFGMIYAGLRKGASIISEISKANIDMIETNNLFEVSMGKVVDRYGNLDEKASKYYTKAMKFQNEMNEKLATNKAELMNYQSMYFSMLNSQLGSKNKDKSYLMSESLTKAGYDIASLYNLSVSDAMNKLKSGLAGQVESLRTIGIDVSESSLAKVLNDVGIERSVQQLSYAEKEVARYIAIINQAGKAQGDFARTFESPANQIKVFKNQLIELKQVAGAFVINVFGNIIVYANAIIMVIKEILKSFASLFGYDLSSGGADLNTAIGVEDLNNGLGSATKKAKELKKQLMGFDEINNIDPASKNKGGSGSGTATGIDDKLLKNLKEWDNKMSSISGKAQEIRDKMLDWLGITDGSYKNLKRIWEVVQTIGVALLSWKVSSAITELFKNLGILNSTQSFQLAFGLTLAITGIFAQYKGTEKLLEGDIDLFSILETTLGTAGGTFGIANILKATNIGKELSFMKNLRIGLGITLLIQAIQVINDGIGEVKDGKITGGSLLKILAGALEAGIASKIAGLALSASAWFTLDIAGIALFMMGRKMYKESVASVLVENYIPLALHKDIEIFLSIMNITWAGLEKIIPEEDIKKLIKNAILRIADWIEKIPVIGESIASGIRAGVKAEENNTSNTIKYSSEEALRKANPWVQEKSKMLGRNSVGAYNSSITSNTDSIRDAISQTTATGIRNSSESVKSNMRQLALDGNKTLNENINGNPSGRKMITTFNEGTVDKTTIKQLNDRVKAIATTSNTTLNSNTNGRDAGKKLITTTESGTRDKTANNNLNSRIKTVGSNINTTFKNSTNSNSVGTNIISGINSGMKSSTTKGSSIWSSINNIGFGILKSFKLSLGIHSPSRVMKEMVGKFIPQGIAVGIDDEANTVYASIKKLNEGIKFNAKDLKIDTNQNINYSAIEGRIRTQVSTVIGSNLIDGIINAIKQGFDESDIKVDVEARTDEGVIFKKVQTQAEEFAIQTGENPFPVLA